MIKTLTKFRIAKHRLLLNLIFLLLSFCIVNSPFAEQKEVEDFPWEIFYPAFIDNVIKNPFFPCAPPPDEIVSPLIIVPEFVEGRKYTNEDSVWRSLDWELSYLLLRQNLWNAFIANPGGSSPESAIGQFGFVEIGYIPDTEEWTLSMRYEGFETKFQYSLPSSGTVGYSSASISIIIGRHVLFGEFLPYTLQISHSERGSGNPFFELEVGENYPFGIKKDYPLSNYALAALSCHSNTPLYVTTNYFKNKNPLPELPPSCDEYDTPVCDENYKTFWFSSVGAISFFITLKE
jgi:hypothetical protein